MKPTSKKRVHMQIVEYIKGQIKNGSLQPGSRLPSERALAEHLNTSRTSIKEAFVVMQSAGLIEIKQGSGARLLNDDIGDIYLKFNLIINQTPVNIIELMELRQAIESEASYYAAIRGTKVDITNIKEKLTNYKNALYSKRLAASENFEFHLSIVKASKNLLFVEVMYLLSERIVMALDNNRQDTQKGWGEENLNEHVEILEAIENGDGVAARIAMANHLNNVRERY